MVNVFFSQLLSTNGDGTGTKEATGDFSSTASLFILQPPLNEIYDVARLFVTIRDTMITAEKYGGIASGLTNGINIDHREEGDIIKDLLGGFDIKTNIDWARFCYDVDLKTWGAGDEFVTVRWTFEKSGEPLILHGGKAGRLVVTCNDDMTGLISHTFTAQGTKGSGNRLLASTLKDVETEPSPA